MQRMKRPNTQIPHAHESFQVWGNHCFQEHLTDKIYEVPEPKFLVPEKEALKRRTQLNGCLLSLGPMMPSLLSPGGKDNTSKSTNIKTFKKIRLDVTTASLVNIFFSITPNTRNQNLHEFSLTSRTCNPLLLFHLPFYNSVFDIFDGMVLHFIRNFKCINRYIHFFHFHLAIKCIMCLK